jgi:transposase-like protein
MKADLREIYGAPTRAISEAAIEVLAEKCGAKYEKAVARLTKDRDAFVDFPAEHWDHLRTSSAIESLFATVRHRTVRTKGSLSAMTAKLMVFKLVTTAVKTWGDSIEGRKPVAESRPRRQTPKRHRSYLNANSQRRLIDLVAQSPAYLHSVPCSLDDVGAFRETACHSGTSPDR